MLALATPVQALFARADDGGYASTRERYAGLTRLKLFKEVESASGQVFVDGLRSKEKGERLAKAEKIALNSNFEGIEDFSEEYYWGLDVAISRQRLCRQYTRCAIKQEAHGVSRLVPLVSLLLLFSLFSLLLLHRTHAPSSLNFPPSLTRLHPTRCPALRLRRHPASPQHTDQRPLRRLVPGVEQSRAGQRRC
jgi:hypothetical protein